MNRRNLTTIILILLVATAGFGRGGQEVPVLAVEGVERAYIAPSNEEAANRELTLGGVIVELPEGGGIRSYSLEIYAASGARVRNISETAEEASFLQSIGVGGEPSVTLPEELAWDGRDDAGEFVPDGEYAYVLTIEDGNRNTARSAPFAVTVDTVAPQIAGVSAQVGIFSPNGDGSRDLAVIQQSGGRAVQWSAQITDSAGTVVWTSEGLTGWANTGGNPLDDPSIPARVEWDGLDDASGEPLPDGAYTYVITGTDRAGNTVESDPVTLRLSNASGLVQIDGPEVFSPAVGDPASFAVSLEEPEGVSGWTLEVRSADGFVVRRLSGSGLPSEPIAFDGTGNPLRPDSSTESRLPDGTYEVRTIVDYENGSIAESAPLSLAIDTTPPQLSISIQGLPDPIEEGAPIAFGGEARPRVRINATGDAVNPDGTVSGEWTGTFRLEGGTTEPFSLGALAQAGYRFPFEWDGTGFDGNPLPDGRYTVQLQGTDAAGNQSAPIQVRFIKDSSSLADARVSLENRLVGQSSDGGIVPAVVRVNAPEDNVSVFAIEFVGPDDRVYNSRGVQTLLPRVEWDGTRNNGAAVPDGEYRARVTIEYLNGDTVELVSAEPIVVDRAASVVDTGPPRISAVPNPFSPDNDGEADVAQIRVIDDGLTAEIVSWEIQIFDPVGQPFRTFSGSGGIPDAIEWDGLSDDGELVQSAEDYLVSLTAQTSDGQTVSAGTEITTDILVIVDGNRRRIRVPSIVFAANSPNLFDVAEEDLIANLDVLRRLAVILNRFPDTDVRIEGHAAQQLFDDRAEIEERTALLPLSRQRAAEVREALIILGVERDRLTAVGLGGSQPVVPPSRPDSSRINRRVEFILEDR